MLVEPHVGPYTKDVRSTDDIQVIDELRCSYRSESPRRVDVRQRRVGETIREVIGETRVGLALREQENEPGKTGGELVHYTWREEPAIADRQIARGAVDFAQRRKAGKHLRAAVQGIPFQRVVMPM